MPEVLPDWFLDAILQNFHLVPKAEEVRVDRGPGPRDRRINGSGGEQYALALAETPGTVPGLPAPINGKCRYFVMRSFNVRNVQMSVAKGIWATSMGNNQRLRQSFRDVEHVILIFAATESRNFMGYAKMLAEADDRLFPGIWGDMSSRLSPNIRVHWIKQCAVPQSAANHIKNPQNLDPETKQPLPAGRSRDGQDLSSSAGESLCRFLWQQPTSDILQGSDLEFEPRDEPPGVLTAGELPERQSSGDRAKANSGASAPLALEDASKKDAMEADDGRERPAPMKMDTFNRDGSWKSQGSGIAVGKALASGSSSLLAAVNEDAQGHHPHSPPMGWPGAHPGWRPPPMDPRHPPGYGYPMPGYFHPAFHGAPPPYDPRFPPAGHGEVPGYWAGAAPQAPMQSSLPPDGWHGASSAAAVDSRRSRSRSRRKKRKRH
jgi:hypothetical protein